MDEGPYIKKRVTSQKEVCNQCKFCNAHKVYTRKSHEVLHAECRHPEVSAYCPSIGRFPCNHLEHAEEDVFTPGWCPVKIKASNYADWVVEIKQLAEKEGVVVDSFTHKDVLILFFLERKPAYVALEEYKDFQRRYFAIQKSNAKLS